MDNPFSDPKTEKAVFIASGPYGLVGRGLFGLYPELIPLDIIATPEDIEQIQEKPFQIPRVDITKPQETSYALEFFAKSFPRRPIVLFHLAALTDTKSTQKELFDNVNVKGTENILKACQAVGAYMIHISTDYVFYADSKESMSYQEDDRPVKCPEGAYAASKFHAENLVLNSVYPRTSVARIAFPYGSTCQRLGLAKKIIQSFRAAREQKKSVKLFSDQKICPSYIPDIHTGLAAMAEKLLQKNGMTQKVFHLTGDVTTPYEFGAAIQDMFDFSDVSIEPGTAAGMPCPLNLSLSHEKTSHLLGIHPTPHQTALTQMKNL